MTEREMVSLGSQLTRSYSDNHKAPFQAHLFVSSWGGQLKKRFDTVLERHHENWRGVTFIEEDFVEVAERAENLMKGKTGGKLAGAFAAEKHEKRTVANVSEVMSSMASEGDLALKDMNTTTEKPQAPVEIQKGGENMMAGGAAPGAERRKEKLADRVIMETNLLTHGQDEGSKEASADEPVQLLEEDPRKDGEIVYLTSDSPHTLDRLRPYSTYVVGGLVDKNRHKGICYKTACNRGIKTAKLPIGEFMEMQSRFVLATNHVVEIIIHWLECGDWGQSFVRVMPKRKGGVLKAAHGITQDVHGHELESDLDKEIFSSNPPEEPASDLKSEAVNGDSWPISS